MEAKGIQPAAYVKPHQAAGESLLPPPWNVARLVEQQAYIQRVEGSSPSVPMILVAIGISFSFGSLCWMQGLPFCHILEYNITKVQGKG